MAMEVPLTSRPSIPEALPRFLEPVRPQSFPNHHSLAFESEGASSRLSTASIVTATAGIAFLALYRFQQKVSRFGGQTHHQVRVSRRYSVGERNRGLDPQRLLNRLRQVGIGTPRPSKVGPPQPAALIAANSTDAKKLLQEHRRGEIEKGNDGLRPSIYRKAYRLPLIVKYHKPTEVNGVVDGPKFRKGKGPYVEDLRSVVSAGGDEFQLDLYHPVGKLGPGNSGLLLWSRSGKLSNELLLPERGVVWQYEVEVCGIVDKDTMNEKMRSGVDIGVTGFSERVYAELREARGVATANLQDPRTILTIATRDARGKIRKFLKACDLKAVSLKITKIGVFDLGSLGAGKLEAATEDEEVWACKMAGLDATDYPAGRESEAQIPAPYEERNRPYDEATLYFEEELGIEEEDMGIFEGEGDEPDFIAG
eukprot:TRINITY_DN8136_c0_g1_i1.p1 TRINITY_DN8136_c0_g1~~TRINITY_DN8136_c0_g1_i1.p1  ORF type:complete len:437 (-),score=73.16 TRINITY_DN8136_c0_g1_i1:85-1353(-)